MSDCVTGLVRPSPPTEIGTRIENVRHGYPERIVPDETCVGAVSWHLKKYDFAREYCTNKLVLDAGCGVGYGGFWLSTVAASVTGVDRSSGAIAYANRRYGNPKVQFVVADLSALPFSANSLDVVCAFEVIEHIPDVTRFLCEVQRVLRGDGTLFASTPSVKTTTTRPRNPHHTVEYSLADWRVLLSDFFGEVHVLGQRRMQSTLHYYLQRADIFKVRTWGIPRFLRRKVGTLLSTTPTEDLSLADLEITEAGLSRPTELVAVCSRPFKCTA